MASTERKRPDSAKQKPPDSAEQKPPSSAERKRPSTAKAKPPDSAEQKPPGSAERKRPDTAKAKPPDSAEQKRPDTAKAKPPDSAEQKPPGSAERKRPSTAKAKPPDTAEQKPPDTAEQKPPDTAEQKPPDTAEQKPPDSAEQKPPDSAEQKPPGSAERKRPSTAKAKPPDTAEQKPPDSAEQKPPDSTERKRPGNPERKRLDEADTRGVPWRRWGPYLSERQWGTVREDYGRGDTWSSFTHDQARSRAYRWGEDGLAGISDERQLMCLALALWNERDPLLKERLFGLTNAEGNHGEDVKECYFYLDATPTSSYLRMLYKYPQAEFPYADLVAVNGARGMSDPEYELIDTGIFNDDRYFDVEVEYAKASPEDMLLQVTVHNRGPDDADAARAADAVVPAHLVLGRRERTAPAAGRQRQRRQRGRGRPTASWAPSGSTPTARYRCWSPGTRPTTRGCSVRRASRPTSRTASTGPSCTARPRRSIRAAPAPRRRCTTY